MPAAPIRPLAVGGRQVERIDFAPEVIGLEERQGARTAREVAVHRHRECGSIGDRCAGVDRPVSSQHAGEAPAIEISLGGLVGAHPCIRVAKRVPLGKISAPPPTGVAANATIAAGTLPAQCHR